MGDKEGDFLYKPLALSEQCTALSNPTPVGITANTVTFLRRRNIEYYILS